MVLEGYISKDTVSVRPEVRTPLIPKCFYYTELFRVTQRVSDSTETGLSAVRGLSPACPSFSKGHPQRLSLARG